MSELFKEQSLLELSAPTGIDNATLMSASSTQIRYRKPSGAYGAWNATVSGTSLIYDLSDGDIDEPGKWMFQSFIVVGGLEGFGAIKTRFFQNHL